MCRMISLVVFFLLCPFTSGFSAAQEQPVELTLMSHDSFSVRASVVQAFEQEHNVTLRFLKAGDAGAALNKAILSRGAPLADVFFGVDNTFMSRALDHDIFEPYVSPLLQDIPDSLQLDPTHRLLPVSYGDVCLNLDREWFTENNIPTPASLRDLADPRYRGLTVVENPATSSPGLAFLLATIGSMGEQEAMQYWARLNENDLMVVNGWQEAYWGHFSAASKGNRPIVVSYATSPAAEVYFAETPPVQAPTIAVTAPGTAFRQVEFVGVLKGTDHPVLARALVDFLLSNPFQEDIPLQMFVFPASTDAVLPRVFADHAAVVREPVTLDPQRIAARREAWIEMWTDTVLR
ncbi:MAG TPA: thiamine ABC transporter substrate-binding protein [Desulfomicrobiaceae bacterium]|nr:thiamine ABC transporter substrate-binding protein [Desulfomicrobiaceae bacterium]